jgi:hypothetical protein
VASSSSSAEAPGGLLVRREAAGAGGGDDDPGEGEALECIYCMDDPNVEVCAFCGCVVSLTHLATSHAAYGCNSALCVRTALARRMRKIC